MLLWGGEQIWMPTDRKQQQTTCGNACGNLHPQSARPPALNDTKNRSAMRCECARPCALSGSLRPVELVTTRMVVEQICENDPRNTVSTDFGVQMTGFNVMPFALFRYFLAS